MDEYQHSVFLRKEKCTGCTLCVKHCPTEAIRIRDGHAVINSQRCIDCGQCIRVCQQKAKKANCDSLESIQKFKWKIALPAPTIYSQFDNLDDIDQILQGLLDIGFDDVYEVASAAELVSAYTRKYLRIEGVVKPAISSACPVVSRLISLRFPSLIGNIIPMLPPMEIAAVNAKREALLKKPDLKEEDIGVCFISPCPAKASYVNNGFGGYKSAVDSVVSISEVYFKFLDVMGKTTPETQLSKTGMIGVSWAESGGESTAIFNERYLAADGIENVISVLDKIENGSFPSLEFIELNACPGGCVGGVMAVENPFIAKARLQAVRRYLPVSQNFIKENQKQNIPDEFFFEGKPDYQPISRLSENLAESMRMLSEIQRIKEELPGIDCASCGAPTCRAFAEDIVKGEANECDCIIKYREALNKYIK